jgi:DNA-binding FadR family transcriptional regulator
MDANTGKRLRSCLENAIVSGPLSVGMQFPTEREIAEHFNLSRAAVRSALKQLEQNGLIVREVGRGTFVADKTKFIFQPLLQVSPGDLVEMRLAIEPGIASLVVYNATREDLARMEAALAKGRMVAGWIEAERNDTEFHDAFYWASHNSGVRQIAKNIREARNSEIWQRLKESSFNLEQWAIYQTEHSRIFERLAARDAAGVKKEIIQHLYGVQKQML